jgi:hypothetical protein
MSPVALSPATRGLPVHWNVSLSTGWMHLIETNDFINLPESRIDSTSHALIARYPYRVTLAKKSPKGEISMSSDVRWKLPQENELQLDAYAADQPELIRSFYSDCCW